jgi:hypothetical protein
LSDQSAIASSFLIGSVNNILDLLSGSLDVA